MDESIRNFLAEIGRKGGKAKTALKIKASQKNGRKNVRKSSPAPDRRRTSAKDD